MKHSCSSLILSFKKIHLINNKKKNHIYRERERRDVTVEIETKRGSEDEGGGAGMEGERNNKKLRRPAHLI
jgi:hypothetical protein